MSLPVDSLREDTLAVDHFREWITKHIDSWFALTKMYRLGVKMEDIVLVTGCHRTRSWSNLAFREVRENTKFSLKVDVAGTLGASIRWKSSKLNVPGALHNQGPSGEVRITNCKGHGPLDTEKLRRAPLGLTRKSMHICPRISGQKDSREISPDQRGSGNQTRYR